MTAFPVGVELKINGTWTDLSQRAKAVPPTVKRGRADESSTVAPTSASVVFDNTDGYLTPRNPESPWYPHIKRGMPCRLSVEAGDPYLLLSGALGSRATTPDNAALDITGDLFIAVELQAPIALADRDTRLQLVAKYNATGNQRSYYLAIDEFGRLQLLWSTDGTSGGLLSAVSTYTLPLRTAGLVTCAAHLDVNDGAGHKIGRFWGINGTLTELLTQLALDETAVRLGPPDTSDVATSIFSGTAPLDIGDIQNTTEDPYYGGVRCVQVRSGDWTGTVVANPDFTAQTVGATGFTDSAGRVWSVQGDAKITDRQTRFTGTTSSIGLSWPKARRRDGNDEGVAHATVEVAGLLRQLQQGAKPAGSTLYRLLTSSSVADTVAAYWPLEDGTDARAIGSPIPGVQPGAYVGVDLATDDTLDASGPLPSVAENTLFRWRFDVPLGKIPADTNWQATMFIKIPEMPSPGELQFMAVDTDSTQVRTWALSITSSVVRMRGVNHAGTEVINATIPSDARMIGTWMVVSINIAQDGANIDWDYDMILIPDGFGFGSSGTIAGSCRRPTRLRAGETSPANGGFSFGHFIVTTNQFTGWLAGADTAWINETAAHRVWRLCREENIPIQVVGDTTMTEFFRGNTELSQLMGVQQSKTLVELLQECAEVDSGILYEQRGQEGLAFRTGKSLTNQTARMTLDVNQDGLNDPFEPVLDDQRIRNDVTVKRDEGSLARVTDDDSIDIEGRYDEDITRNVATDLQLPDQAGWRLHLGTWPELRLPAIATSLLTAGTPVVNQWLDADLGDLLVADNLMRQYDETVTQLLEGYDETLSFFTWEAGLTTSPAGPWEVGVRDDATRGKRDTAGTVLNNTCDSDDTSLTMNVTLGPHWSTAGGDVPFDINMGGEQLRVTAVTLFGGTIYVFTVTRSINGVVKGHLAGTAVNLWRPTVRAL